VDVTYTAIYGGYDGTLWPAPSLPDVEFICFTDDPDLAADGWDVRVVQRPEDHPRMRAKWFKILSHLALPEAERTLWVDGSHRLLPEFSFQWALTCAERTGIAAHAHGRSPRCIYAEVEGSLQFRKYMGLQPSLVEQAEHYRAEGYPANAGLWALGMIARVRSDCLDVAMADWWQECVEWTYQDQVSFPVVMRRHGITPAEFPYPQYGSPWFSIAGHARDD
jgi:hypothetical protein